MTVPGPAIRQYDISGRRFPVAATPLTQTQQTQAVPVSRQPEVEPVFGVSREFLLSWSLVVAGNSTAALFTVDGANNVTGGAAFQLPEVTRARISGVIIEGDTGAAAGTPILQFSIRADVIGNQRIQGWEAVNLPTRGGVVNMGIEPFTIVPSGYFFGAFVQNLDANQHYAAITIQGWTI